MTAVPKASVPEVLVLNGPGVLPWGPAIRSVYAQTFAAESWLESPDQADTYLVRLAQDVRRPGFTAACALLDGEVVGFATAWTTSTPLPSSRCYPQVTALLGLRRWAAWLDGAREVDELAVLPRARGAGLGSTLLDAVTTDAPRHRCWLLTSARAAGAVGFYRRTCWHQVTHPAPQGRSVAVFLSPLHPAVDGREPFGRLPQTL